MPEISDEDILLFIYENQPVRASQLEERFVAEMNIVRISKGTLYKRLKKFRESETVEKTLDQVTGRPFYSISTIEIPHLEQIKKEKEWLNYYRKMSKTNGPFIIAGAAVINPIQVQGSSPDKKIIINAMSDIPQNETSESQKTKLDMTIQALMYEYNNKRQFYRCLNNISNVFTIAILWDP